MNCKTSNVVPYAKVPKSKPQTTPRRTVPPIRGSGNDPAFSQIVEIPTTKTAPTTRKRPSSSLEMLLRSERI